MSSKFQAVKPFIVTLLLGISSGLPLLAFDSLIKAWLSESGVSLATVGYFGFVTLPYSCKLLWAPLLDRHTIKNFGRRRGWLLFSQFFLALVFLAISTLPSVPSLSLLFAIVLIGAFSSATQDIVADAYRREIFSDDKLGLASTVFVVGYRIGMIVSGSVALALADYLSWSSVYQILAGAALLGLLVTAWSDEPNLDHPIVRKAGIWSVYIEPLSEFFSRNGALIIIAFAFFYKIGDSLADAMRVPFLLEIGFTKLEIGEYAKAFGLISAIAGGLVGGTAMLKLGIYRSLFIFGVLQMVSTAGFFLLTEGGKQVSSLAAVIVIENFTGGMGTAAFVAFLSQVCNRQYSAAQYAALTSFMKIPALLITTQSGVIAQNFGWRGFYVVCVLIALPGLGLCVWLPRGGTGIPKKPLN